MPVRRLQRFADRLIFIVNHDIKDVISQDFFPSNYDKIENLRTEILKVQGEKNFE